MCYNVDLKDYLENSQVYDKMWFVCWLSDNIGFYLSEFEKRRRNIEYNWRMNSFLWTYVSWNLIMKVDFGHNHGSTPVSSFKLEFFCELSNINILIYIIIFKKFVTSW